MQRVCFTLQVRRERLEEYTERHKTVWPAMIEALRETGWRNYSLYLRPDGLLVGYLETDDFDAARARMAERQINTEWQHTMAPFFEHSSSDARMGQRPDEAMMPLIEVFHLD